MSNRQEIIESNDGEEWLHGSNLLKPKFKIKSFKNVPKKQEIIHQDSHKQMVHVRNFTLDHIYTRRH